MMGLALDPPPFGPQTGGRPRLEWECPGLPLPGGGNRNQPFTKNLKDTDTSGPVRQVYV